MEKHPNKQAEKFWALKSFKEADIELSGIGLNVLLKNCFESGVDLHLGMESLDSTVSGRIRSLGQDSLTLEIETHPGLELETNLPIRISLSDKGRLYRFDSRIIDHSESDESASQLVTLTLPNVIHSSQVRRALRIPASWSSELKARVDLDGRNLNVSLIELSLGGFRCRLQQGAKYALQPDDLVTTILDFRNQRAELLAEVCGKQGDIVRFRFPEIDLDENMEAPEDFRNLLIELGEAWTKSNSAPAKKTKKFHLAKALPNIVWLFP
jgi:hypothetical protein